MEFMPLIAGLAAALALALLCQRARFTPEAALVGAILVVAALFGATEVPLESLASLRSFVVVLLLVPLFHWGSRLGELDGARTRSCSLREISLACGGALARGFFFVTILYLWLPSSSNALLSPLSMALLFGGSLAVSGPLLFWGSQTNPRTERDVQRRQIFEIVLGLLVLQTLHHCVVPEWDPTKLGAGVGLAAVSAGVGVTVGFVGGCLQRRQSDAFSTVLLDLAIAAAALFISGHLCQAFASDTPGLVSVVVAGWTRRLTSRDRESVPAVPESFRQDGFWSAAVCVSWLAIGIGVGTVMSPYLLLLDHAGLVLSIWASCLAVQLLLVLTLDFTISPGAGGSAWHDVLFSSWSGQPGLLALAGVGCFTLLPRGVEEGLGPTPEALTVILQVILFSMLVQGITRNGLTRLCRSAAPENPRARWDALKTRRLALRAGLDRLIELHEDGQVSEAPYETIRRGLTRELREIDVERSALRIESPGFEKDLWTRALEDVLAEARLALELAREEGEISSEAALEFERSLSERWIEATRLSVEEAIRSRDQ